MTELLEEIDEPPPCPRGFDRDWRLRRELRKELRKSDSVVRESLLGNFAVLTHDRDLRATFVQVDAHVYHLLGLLFQRGLRPTLRASLFQAGQEANVLMTSREMALCGRAFPSWRVKHDRFDPLAPTRHSRS